MILSNPGPRYFSRRSNRICNARIVGFLIGSLIFLFAALCPRTAAAKHDCEARDLSVLLSAPVRQLNFPPQPPVDFTVRRRNPSVACDFWVGFTRGQAASYDRKLLRGSVELDYDVFKTPSSPPLTLKTYPEAASLGEVYTGTFEKGGNHPNQWTFTSRPQMIKPLPGPFRILPPGLYTDSVRLQVFEGTFPPTTAPLELANAIQTYEYMVFPFAMLSLLDSGVPFTHPPIMLKTLNFGTLREGQVLGFDLVLLYNWGYRVTFTSENGSRLKHDTANSYVPYTLRIDGSPVNLGPHQAAEVATGAGMSPTAPIGHRLPVTVTIHSVKASLSGPHSDRITIVMTSL